MSFWRQRNVIRFSLSGTLRPARCHRPLCRPCSRPRSERSPEAIALVFEETTLSYAQLNAQANRLAHLLIGRGIGPENLVAVALPRSIEMVVGLLAILKAGAAYLPLDPDYPAERLAYMLGDAQPACVLTTRPDRRAPAQ